MQLFFEDADLDRLAQKIADLIIERMGVKPQPADALFTEQEAAVIFKVKPSTLRDARRRGELEFSRIGRYVRYTTGQLEAWRQRDKKG